MNKERVPERLLLRDQICPFTTNGPPSTTMRGTRGVHPPAYCPYDYQLPLRGTVPTSVFVLL